MATMMDAPVSVTSTTSGGSRLAQMQARFQQKQMQEKEQKLLRLYESQTQRAFQRVGRGSAGSSSSSVSSTSSSMGAGKVRQLFQERRHPNRSYSNGSKAAGSGTTGWDRSYPLEPLESTTKQRLQASRSTGNLKVARGTSLERSYSNNVTTNNHYPVKNQARRSKSQVRSNNHLQQNVVVDVGGSFRQLSLSQQKLYVDDDEEDDYDDDDDVDYPRHHHGRGYQDEQNNRIHLEREHREVELFHKHRIYDDDDIENEDPPFQQLDDVDDFNDTSHVFQKLPNVGGRLLMENKANNNNNNNVDRYKTYNATSNGIRNNRRNVGDKEERRMTPPAAAAAREPPQRRREADVAPATKPAVTRTSVAAKKTDIKVATHAAPAKTSSPRNNTTTKPDSGYQRTSTDSGKKQMPVRQQQQTPSRGSPQQAPQRGPPARGPAARGAPGRGPPGAQAANSDLTECRICGRAFATDRIEVHQSICAKTSQKKRKTFDPVKQRVKGTEAESFLRKGRPQTVKTIKKNNWRQKHEDFINSIRAAKDMKAHLAKGGKLSDLPPPPPSDYSDYVECPHCHRRFNQQAAERHIPKCASYDFNKPKQPVGRGGPQKGAVPRRR